MFFSSFSVCVFDRRASLHSMVLLRKATSMPSRSSWTHSDGRTPRSSSTPRSRPKTSSRSTSRSAARSSPSTGPSRRTTTDRPSRHPPRRVDARTTREAPWTDCASPRRFGRCSIGARYPRAVPTRSRTSTDPRRGSPMSFGDTRPRRVDRLLSSTTPPSSCDGR